MNSDFNPIARVSKPDSISFEYCEYIADKLRSGMKYEFYNYLGTNEVVFLYEYLMYDNPAPIPAGLARRANEARYT